MFAEYPEQLDERAVSLVEQWFGAFPETKFLYGAQDQRSGGKRCFPWFKPCLSPDTLLGFFYFGSYFAVDRAWAERVSLSGYEEARSNLYDFVLRLLRPYFEKPEAVSYDKDAPDFITGKRQAGLRGKRPAQRSCVWIWYCITRTARRTLQCRRIFTIIWIRGG